MCDKGNTYENDEECENGDAPGETDMKEVCDARGKGKEHHSHGGRADDSDEKKFFFSLVSPKIEETGKKSQSATEDGIIIVPKNER